MGKHFYDSDGKPWRGRGVSLFLLPGRYMNGENIQPDIDRMILRGRNEAVVFGSVNWDDNLAASLNWKRPWERPDHDAKLGQMFDLFAANGLRVEYVPLTYAFDMNEMRAYVQRVYNVAAGRWNVMVRVANEAENNQLDPVDVISGVDTRGVLTDYGLDPARHAADGGPDNFGPGWAARLVAETPVRTYASTHDLARDAQHSPRNSKDAEEFEALFGVPFKFYEPVGICEPTDPRMMPIGNDFYIHRTGGGVRTASRDVIVGGQIIADFYTAGYCVHPECGVVEGRMPRPETEPVQDGIMATCCAIDQFLPTDIERWRYARPGYGDFGLAWADGDTDSYVGHAYAQVSPDGNVQYAVVPMPRPGWQAVPVNGWHVDAVGPVPYVLRLVK